MEEPKILQIKAELWKKGQSVNQSGAGGKEGSRFPDARWNASLSKAGVSQDNQWDENGVEDEAGLLQ